MDAWQGGSIHGCQQQSHQLLLGSQPAIELCKARTKRSRSWSCFVPHRQIRQQAMGRQGHEAWPDVSLRKQEKQIRQMDEETASKSRSWCWEWRRFRQTRAKEGEKSCKAFDSGQSIGTCCEEDGSSSSNAWSDQHDTISAGTRSVFRFRPGSTSNQLGNQSSNQCEWWLLWVQIECASGE